MITGEKFVELMTEEIRKSDIINDIKKDKDFEKRVKEIIANTLTDFFKAMYQHNATFKNLMR